MSTANKVLGPADHGVRMTLDEFFEADAEEGYRYELADGVLVVIDIPKTPHARVVSWLYGITRDYQREYPGVIDYFGGGSEIRIWNPDGRSVRHPDLGIVLPNAAFDTKGNLQAAIVAEVVSPSSQVRDYVEKRRDYLACPVLEYWIVDPILRQVTVLIRPGLDVTDWSEQILGGEDRLGSRLLPGLDVPITHLWVGLPSEHDAD